MLSPLNKACFMVQTPHFWQTIERVRALLATVSNQNGAQYISLY